MLIHMQETQKKNVLKHFGHYVYYTLYLWTTFSKCIHKQFVDVYKHIYISQYLLGFKDFAICVFVYMWQNI